MRQHMKVRWVVVAGIHHKLGMGQAYQGWHFASLMQWLHCFSCALHPNPRASPPSACATRALPKRRTARWAARTTPAGSSTARARLSSAGCAGLPRCWPSCRPVAPSVGCCAQRGRPPPPWHHCGCCKCWACWPNAGACSPMPGSSRICSTNRWPSGNAAHPPINPFIPPIRFIIFIIPPPLSFFIIACICSNWLSMRLTS